MKHNKPHDYSIKQKPLSLIKDPTDKKEIETLYDVQGMAHHIEDTNIYRGIMEPTRPHMHQMLHFSFFIHSINVKRRKL